MSDERRTDSPDPELERALSKLDVPIARAEFREDLREQFMTGDFGEERLEPERPIARMGMWGAVGLVAATIAVLLVVRPWEESDGVPVEPGTELVAEDVPEPEVETPSDPHEIEAPPAVEDAVAWRVVGTRKGAVRLDGVEFPPEEYAALDRALRDGREIEVLDGELRLRFGNSVLVEATETSVFSLTGTIVGEPASDSDLSFAVERGVLRVCTGPEFPGTTLALSTPDVELGVTGTAFAVDLYDRGTCVCCTEGAVAVKPVEIDCTHEVAAETMVFAFRDRTVECATGAAMQPHAEPLRALEEFAKTIW